MGNKVTELLKRIEAKEQSIQEDLNSSLLANISTSGKRDIVKDIEGIMDTLKDWKIKLQKEDLRRI